MLNKSDLNSLIEDSRDIKVLYVEDEELEREAVKKLLNNIFNNIEVACNGTRALTIFNNNKIDLVITDINMPFMDGIKLIEEIKKINSNIPVVVISAQNDNAKIYKAILAGIDSFVMKPIQLSQLIKSIRKVVDQTSIIKNNEKNLIILKQYKEITNRSAIISKTDVNGTIIYVNDNFCKTSGYTREELLGKPHSIVRHPDNKATVFEKIWHTIKIKKEPWQGIIKNLAKNGHTYYVKSTIQPLLDQDNNIIEFMALRDDISEIMSEKKQLMSSIKTNTKPLVILIQIENFDILDNFYDHQTVENIEMIFGDTLLSLIPNNKVFGRIYTLGDGRFALSEDYNKLLTSDIDIEEQLICLIKNTKEATIKFDNIEYDVSIAVSYSYGESKNYDNAKYGIDKAINNNQSLVFANNLTNEVQKAAQKNIETIQMIKKALDTSNIISYFQPIIDNKTREIYKYESLVRLINEKGEIISPYFFLDVSKKGTYYTKITQRVIECSFAALDHIKHNISINISVLDIENKDIREKLIELVSTQKYKGRVTFELLEDEEIKDFDTVKKFINYVKKVGNVKIAIDDFGSGYSSFERLLEYNPDILKIDGSLIKNIETDTFSKNLVETIVSFAKKQNIKTVAEYVENENIYNILNKIGIDYSQGYYFGKPEKLV